MGTSFLKYLLILLTIDVSAQDTISLFSETEVSIQVTDGQLFGSLVIPNNIETSTIALFIAGSGPTDRNGNNMSGLNTDAYKLLCYALAENGIASLRFDKWGSGKSISSNQKEIIAKRDFESEINDAVAWIEYLQNDGRFNQLTVIGHSQGSLVGILAAKKVQTIVTKFISISGLGVPGNETLKEQLGVQPKFVGEAANPILDSLANGLLVKKVPPFLQALFSPTLQPYLISWFKYNPAEELSTLAIPSVIIQGTNDIQVKAGEATILASKSPLAKVLIIENMNHVLRILESNDRSKNFATYAQPALPISTELVQKISDFLLEK